MEVQHRFPTISGLLLACCWLVSLPTLFDPDLFLVFGGDFPPTYFWQILTRHFSHGSYLGLGLPLWAHLLANSLIILTLGAFLEQLVGSGRLLALSSAALLAAIAYFTLTGTPGNGASTMAWALTPGACIGLINQWRQRGKALLGDPLFVTRLLVLGLAWIAVTLANLALGWHTSNITHLMGALIGWGFTLFWKRPTPVPLSRAATLSLLPLPLSLILILSLAFTGVLTNHLPTAFITSIYPESGSIESLRQADERILITFKNEMDPHIQSVRYYISTYSDSLTASHEWLSTQTLQIQFSRPLHDTDRIEVFLSGFQTQSQIHRPGGFQLTYMK